jgi:hypothetical protein
MKVLLFFVGFIFILTAQTDKTVMKSLKLAPSAFSSGKGDNGVAEPISAARAMHFNPAGLVYHRNRRGYNLGLNYANYNSGLPDPDGFYMYTAGSYKKPGLGAFGFSLRYMSLGEQEFTQAQDIFQDVTQKFLSNELEISFAYARYVLDKLAVGGKVSYLRSQLIPENFSAGGINYIIPWTFAFDLGALYRFDNLLNTTLGASISNLGGKMKFIKYTQNSEQFNIPTTFRVGIQSDLYNISDELGNIKGGIETRFLSAVGIAVGLNLEYNFQDLIELRMGYVFDDNVFKGKNYFTTGFGFHYMTYDIDFSYQLVGSDLGQVNPIDGSLNISLTLDLEEQYYDDTQELPDFGNDDYGVNEAIDNIDHDYGDKLDKIVESYEEGGNNLYEKLNESASYKVIESKEYEETGRLAEEANNIAFMDRLSKDGDIKDLDYVVSGSIILVVVKKGVDSIYYNISHVKFDKTDILKSRIGDIQYVKGGQYQSIILFNRREKIVEKCYSDSRERYIFFETENIRYRWDSETLRTEVIQFIE